MSPITLRPTAAMAALLFASVSFAQAPSASGAKHGKHPGDQKGPPSAASHGHPGGFAAPHGSMMPHPGGSAHGPMGPMGSIHQGFKSETIKKRLAELMETHKSRRAAHLAKLRARYNAVELTMPALMMELRHHARRMAFLNRARLIAENELEEPKRAKVLARIDKLIEKENTRHDRHVERLRNPGAPMPSASTAAPHGSGPPPKPKAPPKAASSAGGAP